MAQSSSGILIRASGAVLLTVVSATQLIDLSLVNWLADKNRSSINQYVAESIHNTFFVSNPAMQRLSVYKQAADFLQSQNQAKGNGKARMTLATWEPGVLGYYLPGSEIIDLGGLVTDETLQYYPVPLSERSRREVWGSIPAQAIVEMKPEQVIFFDSFADNGLLKNKQFLETYKLSQFWPLELWGGHGLFLFERQKTN